MKDLRTVSNTIKKLLNEAGIEKYRFSLSETETQEFNADAASFNLYRTLFDCSVNLTVFIGTRKGNVNGNDFEDDSLKSLVMTAVGSAQASPEDPANEIAPCQGKKTFRSGCYDGDMEGLFSRSMELFDAVGKEYPLVKVMMYVTKHVRKHSLFISSNGTDFEKFGGNYQYVYEYAANDGTNTTGLDAVGQVFSSLDKPFIEMDGVRKHIEDTISSLNPVAVQGKFEGTVVMTPSMTASFFQMMLDNFISGTVIMDGTSPWLNSIGQKVASDSISVELKPSDPRLVNGESWTADGFVTEDVRIIENGVLNTHLLSLYFANKTGRPVTKNTGFDLVVANGEKSIDEIIKGIDKGLVLGGFSGGEPGTNGEFSGVAKNSFLIENGKVTKAVKETMVNGNFLDVVRKVVAVSKEVECDGMFVLPYIAMDGIVISGK